MLKLMIIFALILSTKSVATVVQFGKKCSAVVIGTSTVMTVQHCLSQIVDLKVTIDDVDNTVVGIHTFNSVKYGELIRYSDGHVIVDLKNTVGKQTSVVMSHKKTENITIKCYNGVSRDYRETTHEVLRMVDNGKTFEVNSRGIVGGCSGGGAYDHYGNLVGIVVSTTDGAGLAQILSF